jgi:hypothetical protein
MHFQRRTERASRHLGQILLTLEANATHGPYGTYVS